MSNKKEEISAPEPLSIRAKPPKASIALNKKTVTIVVIVIGVVAGLAILQGISGGKNISESKLKDNRPAQVGEAVRNLPNDYSSLPKPKISPIQNSQLVAGELNSKLSDEEKFKAEQKLLRIKQAALARAADVTFSGVKIEDQKFSINSGVGNSSEQSLSDLLPQNTNSRDENNRQDDKLNFLTKGRDTSSLLHSRLISPFSKYQLMAGAILPGIMLTGINSDLPGQILGQISQNVYDTKSGRYLLLPQGTKVIGEYDSRVTYGQERVLIVWTRLILPNGKSITLEGMPGVDLSGYAGLKDKVNNHYFKLLSGVVFGSVIGAGAQIARGSNQTIDPTFGQLALEGAAQNINEAGQQITRKNLNLQPTIEISPGHRFNVFVTKDFILEPYEK